MSQQSQANHGCGGAKEVVVVSPVSYERHPLTHICYPLSYFYCYRYCLPSLSPPRFVNNQPPTQPPHLLRLYKVLVSRRSAS
jgi:hypothetical protein